MATKNFILPLHIYPMNIMVSFGEGDEVVKNRLKRQFGVTGTDLWRYQSDNDSGRCCSFDNNEILIRLKKIPKTAIEYSYLHHEIFHAVTYVMYKIGIELVVTKSDESYAYLIGYLTKEIYKRIK